MAVSVEKIEAIAPDLASLSAALKIKPSAWAILSQNEADGFAWGECQGSGSTPYRVALSVDDLGYKCSCPSRKFPCKHSLGLMLQLAKSTQSFGAADTPDWVKDWAGRRRLGSENAAAPKADKPKASLGEAEQAAGAEAVAQSNPEAEARAAKQRERLKAQRETSIIAGLDEFDLWISDILERGLSAFLSDAAQPCRVAAQRLVDAKASSLAASVDALPSALLALPPAARADAAIEALGSWHLLAQAYRRQDALPSGLRHDVRRLIGWSEQRQALLDDPSALRRHSVWRVIATHSQAQPDKLRRIETWLADAEGGYALLMDFVPLSTGATGSPYFPGERFSAELVFYPSAAPMRALIASRSEATAEIPVSPPLPSLRDALENCDRLRNLLPWLGAWPVSFAAQTVSITNAGDFWAVGGGNAVPLDSRQKDETRSLAGLALTSMTGFWNGACLNAAAAETSIGKWLRQ